MTDYTLNKNPPQALYLRRPLIDNFIIILINVYGVLFGALFLFIIGQLVVVSFKF